MTYLYDVKMWYSPNGAGTGAPPCRAPKHGRRESGDAGAAGRIQQLAALSVPDTGEASVPAAVTMWLTLTPHLASDDPLIIRQLTRNTREAHVHADMMAL